MNKDDYFFGYTERYIVLPQTYAVWDTQTNCWVADTANTEKQIVHESAQIFNEIHKSKS
jgi:hypothetical protein